MMHYQYVARDATGRFARGVSAADSPANLRTTLQANGLQLISFQQQSSAAQRADWMNMSIDSRQLLRRLPVASRHVELCLQQLALMLRSGLDLLSALKTIRHQSESLALRYALEDISRSIQQGHSLASAMEAQRAFPPLVIQLVKVGEESGDLSRVLQQAARHISQRRATLAEVRMALAYPLIVGVAALGIAIYLIFNVIPELQKFINAMGRKLPRMTQNLVDLAQWIQANGTTTIIISTVLVFFVYVLLRWSPTRLLIDTWLLRVPIVGGVFRLAGTATLASSLAVMIRSGTKLVTALSLAESLQTNRYLAAQVANASEAIKRGEGLSHTLASGHGYNPMLVSMLEVAERTGHLEASLEDVAEYCEVELRKKVKRLSAMVEPAIILVAGGIVGYVYMAFFMALMSTGGNIR